jgi:hypothetical protein
MAVAKRQGHFLLMQTALSFRSRAWLPALLACPHQNAYRHGPIHPHLAAKAELSQNTILFKAVVLSRSHLGFIGTESDSTGSAAGQASAPVADVNPVLFKGENQLSSFFDGKGSKTFNGYIVLWHARLV